MKKLVMSLGLVAATAFGQYKLESAGAPPAELSPEIRAALQQDGAKITGPSGVFCELWFRTKVPTGDNGEQNVSFAHIQQGVLLGAIRFPGKGADRRGQPLKPGVYTMRLSFFPVDGAHQGVSQTRDFALLTPAADDKDLNAAPDFKQLVEMSKKASGTSHPAVLNVWKADSAGPTTLKQEGDDWVLYSTMGDRPIAVIVVGTYQG
jgi:hypothetical protein